MFYGFRPPTVTAEPLFCAGWTVAAGFAATQPPRFSRNFFAIYNGDSFAAPERGLIAGMASAHPAMPDAPAPGNAAQLAVHSLAEGYFGAQRTLSPRRAAGIALTAVNRWLFGQAASLAPVSLTTLIFQHAKIDIAHIGTCQLFRGRGGVLTPLLRDHARTLPDGGKTPTRAIGLDLEISIDYAEEQAEPADRYILLAGLDGLAPDLLYARLSETLRKPGDAEGFAKAVVEGMGNLASADISAMVLDVLAVPGGQEAATLELAGLPLRPEPKEGDSWDGFQLGKTLYRGRYTMLKAAYDTIENREVALKIPLPAMLQDEVFTAGFMREAWIGTTVRGTNVARYLELTPGRRSSLYLIMPLYRGETLEVRLHRAPPVSLPEGVGIALKLCEAVQDLAAIQIIHRDIKPDNIMLLENNEVRLLDLGLAYLPGIDAADAVKPGGTIRYMAPELLTGTMANARSEVYSLAVTIYRMFTDGAFPFGQREAWPLKRLRPDLPRWLGACLAKALAPKPAERYADAGELAAALQLGLIGSHEEAPAPLKALPFTALQLWRAAAVFFALCTLFLVLKGVN
jgi:hypothetical protein